MEKIDLSAIVAGYNEGNLLANCLDSINFCDEILYFDLGSDDNSVEIAKRYGAKVIKHERVLAVEWIHTKYATQTMHSWVLIIDPDERLDSKLKETIIKLFLEGRIDDKVGAITVPCRYYFKNKPLKGTPWGGKNRRILLVHNQRFDFYPHVHDGRKLREGFTMLEVGNFDSEVSHHYWMESYRQFILKHKRYLKNEGGSRYQSGRRTTWKGILNSPVKEFRYSFFSSKGNQDGIRGFILSILWAWYQTNAKIELWREQKKRALKF